MRIVHYITKRKHLFVLSSVLTICFFITACNNDPAIPNEVSKVIGPQGGTLATADDKLTIDIPQGIMESGTTVTIAEVSQNENPYGIGSMFSIRSDVNKFEDLVTLKFRYSDDLLLNGTTPELLTVSYRENGGAWKTQPNAVLNKSDKSITVKTNHFSQWTLSKSATGYVDITSPEDTLHINLPIYRFTNKNGDGDAYSDSLIVEFGNRMGVYGVLSKIGTFEVTTDTIIDMHLYVLTYNDINPGENIYLYSGPVSVTFTSMGNQSGDVIGGNFEGTIERVPDKKPILISGKLYFQVK